MMGSSIAGGPLFASVCQRLQAPLVVHPEAARLSKTMEKLGAAHSHGLTVQLHGLHNHNPDRVQAIWCLFHSSDKQNDQQERMSSGQKLGPSCHASSFITTSNPPALLAFMTAAPRLRIGMKRPLRRGASVHRKFGSV